MRVAQYLKDLACAACKGVGGKGSKECKFCNGSGFRDGDVHLLVSAKQVRRGK